MGDYERELDSDVSAIQHRVEAYNPSVTLIDRSMAEAADILESIEIHDDTMPSDIVGIRIDDAVIPVQILAQQTTGELVFSREVDAMPD